ncbi:hypothetical protein [Sutcliffiella rhizosphaerae]|uniref:Uncharacterized protein n=1 Tax=Sutcliffiella rhizosphaerae TaxID=2880967 RepID=A0ABN8ABH8_9BACI|nr:hypothetical protein [Sutcliffiella rhizosphaerae]CAG9621536.1 hypothetical protein BACCIP111883_02309 [Sutcliffiella rhizosphaerae]
MKFLYYFLSTIIVGIIFYVGLNHQTRFHEIANTTYNLMPLLIYTTVFPIVIGMLFRVPKLIMEMVAKQKWTFNWKKVVAIGVPSLYLACIPLLGMVFGLNVWLAKQVLHLGDPILPTTAGIVFGYILLDSLHD